MSSTGRLSTEATTGPVPARPTRRRPVHPHADGHELRGEHLGEVEGGLAHRGPGGALPVVHHQGREGAHVAVARVAGLPPGSGALGVVTRLVGPHAAGDVADAGVVDGLGDRLHRGAGHGLVGVLGGVLVGLDHRVATAHHLEVTGDGAGADRRVGAEHRGEAGGGAEQAQRRGGGEELEAGGGDHRVLGLAGVDHGVAVAGHQAGALGPRRQGRVVDHRLQDTGQPGPGGVLGERRREAPDAEHRRGEGELGGTAPAAAEAALVAAHGRHEAGHERGGEEEGEDAAH